MPAVTLPLILEKIEFDAEGFMVDPKAWTPEIGQTMAEVLGIRLTERHWVVINFARKEFAEHRPTAHTAAHHQSHQCGHQRNIPALPRRPRQNGCPSGRSG